MLMRGVYYFLEKSRVFWWKRAYKKIWDRIFFDGNMTCSTGTAQATEQLVDYIAANIKPQKGTAVLDIGCGNGVLGEKVFKNCGLLLQVDYCPEALKLVNRTNGVIKKYIMQANIADLPFRKNIFDYIFIYSVIHNAGSLENAKSWIKNILPLLKDSGRLYIGDVPIAKKLRKEMSQRLKHIKTLDHIKYFFAEFMQNSFSIDDFLGLEGIKQLNIFPHPEYLKFHRWRVDIEITKEANK